MLLNSIVLIRIILDYNEDEKKKIFILFQNKKRKYIIKNKYNF